MNRHFDQGLNVKELILRNIPKHVVEVGAQAGLNTKKLASIKDVVGFKLTVISDDVKDKLEGVEYIKGISYLALKDFPDDSIDICIIDTDHNYWTLREELNVVHTKVKEGGYILLHDVDAFYHNTGVCDAYYCPEVPYPKKEIMDQVELGSTGCAALDFLTSARFHYKLERWVPEFDGACSIKKVRVSTVSLMKVYDQFKESNA